MNWRALAVVLVAASAALHAQLNPPVGGTTGGGGGGTTEGAAISGGTASRLLFSDATTEVSTASPALGAALQLSSTADIRGAISNGGSATCASVGVAGDVCFTDSIVVAGTGTDSGAYFKTSANTGRAGGFYYAADASTRALILYYDIAHASTHFRNDLVIGNATAGRSVAIGAVKATGPGSGVEVARIVGGNAGVTTLANWDGVGNYFNLGGADIRGAISNGGSGTCNGLVAGSTCINDAEGTVLTGGSTLVHGALNVRSQSAAANTSLNVQTSGGSTGIALAWGNTATAPFAGKGYLVSVNAGTVFAVTNNNALNTEIFQWYDSTSAAPQKLWTMDGEGTLQSHLSTTLGAGDCDADAEVGRIRRYAKDASNITLCGCQKVGGVFSWAAMITGGDCT